MKKYKVVGIKKTGEDRYFFITKAENIVEKLEFLKFAATVDNDKLKVNRRVRAVIRDVDGHIELDVLAESDNSMMSSYACNFLIHHFKDDIIHDGQVMNAASYKKNKVMLQDFISWGHLKVNPNLTCFGD